MFNRLKLAGFLCPAACVSPPALAQVYAVGADASFLGKCEQDGVVIKEGDRPRDVLAILRKHNYNGVRL
jgi:arabinogalactan endo-1,4-beta-galactosidase